MCNTLSLLRQSIQTFSYVQDYYDVFSAFYVHKIIRYKLCFFFAIASVSSSFAHAQYTLKVKWLIILRYVVKISILVHVFQHLVRLSSIAVNCICERVAVDRQKSVVYRMGQIYSTMLWYSF